MSIQLGSDYKYFVHGSFLYEAGIFDDVTH